MMASCRFLAKILVPAGAKDVPVGQPIAITVCMYIHMHTYINIYIYTYIITFTHILG